MLYIKLAMKCLKELSDLNILRVSDHHEIIGNERVDELAGDIKIGRPEPILGLLYLIPRTTIRNIRKNKVQWVT